MKRTVKIVALVLLLSMALTAFVSCARPSGTYVDSAGEAMYVFDGDEFIYTYNKVEFRGTYKIVGSDEDMRIILTILESATENTPLTKLDKPEYIGDEKGVDYLRGETADGKEYVKISTTVYYKIKK